MALATEHLLNHLRTQVIVFGHKNIHRQRCRVSRRGRFFVPGGPFRNRCVVARPAQHLTDRFEQLVLLNWLQQMGVDPQFAGPGQIARPLFGPQQDDAGSGELGPLADLGGHRQTIRAGHSGVQ